ncbi:MAG: hypothetical protein PVSMB7_09210 [Chloroflexota bacterium]
MQGHYAGTWRSDGDYHFAVFGTDLDLKIAIDGTLDAIVSFDGHVNGTATGKVDAPITAYGRPDISGGIGTITGQIRGVFSSSGSLLVLTNAVIDMHWGTFGGGHAIERTIAMPDYSFPVESVDCVSAAGSISETNFPVQNIVADEAGQLVQLPGIGVAGGMWHLESGRATHFRELSQQVDAFISSANRTLDNSAAPPSGRVLDQQVVQPLHILQDTIRQDPDVARCLLERLAAWEGSAIAALRQRAHVFIGSNTLDSLRHAADVLAVARTLSADCTLGPDSTDGEMNASLLAMMNRAVRAYDWNTTALVARELVRSGTPGTQVRDALFDDIHVLLAASSGRDALLMVARFASVTGDGHDASSALQRITALGPAPAHPDAMQHRKKPRRKKHAKATPSPTATPRPAPSAGPPSSTDLLFQAVAHMSGSVSAGGTPRFFWSQVPGATRYSVFVVSAPGDAILWSWAGNATMVAYGDTAIDTVVDSADDGWTAAAPTGYRWGILAVNDAGQIVGMKLP